MEKIVPHDAILIPDNAACVFQGEIFDVYQWPQQMFDGSTKTFEMLRRPDTVEFIGVQDGKLLFTEEEQPGVPKRLRMPGGRVDPGEDWLTAVKRECLEELGLVFRNWKLVLVEQPLHKGEWFCAVFIASDVVNQQQPTPDSGERITLRPLDFATAKELVIETTKADLSYIKSLFANAPSLDTLMALPEFKGQTIKR